MKRWPCFSLFVACAASVFLLSCGGSDSPTGPGPLPTPVPTPTPDPQAGLPPGPVTRAVLYIHQQYENGNPNAGGTLKDERADAQGRWIAAVGDFIVLDTTPMNAGGQACRSAAPPRYRLQDSERAFDMRDSSNPFLYRVDVVHTGEVEIISTVDGVDSAPLRIIVQ